jgi:hypothetical protein
MHAYTFGYMGSPGCSILNSLWVDHNLERTKVPAQNPESLTKRELNPLSH